MEGQVRAEAEAQARKESPTLLKLKAKSGKILSLIKEALEPMVRLVKNNNITNGTISTMISKFLTLACSM
jgi:hypothetical protein